LRMFREVEVSGASAPAICNKTMFCAMAHSLALGSLIAKVICSKTLHCPQYLSSRVLSGNSPSIRR